MPDMSWRVIQGDCLEVMRTMPDKSVDLVFTSPPYNMGNSTGGGMSAASAPTSKWKAAQLREGYATHTDNMPWPEYIAWQKDVLRECWRLLSDRGAIYYNHKPRVLDGILQTPLDFNPELPVRQIVIWDRANGFNFNVSFYRSTHEWIVIFAKPDFRLRSQGASGIGDVWHFPPESNSPHPAPFPLALPLMALDSTSAQVILDPFCGSGTTGEATVIRGKQFIGIELDPGYCEMARRRIGRAVKSDQQAVMELSA